jgi:nucleoside-diphosphate-sugar epimerase
MPDCVDVVFHVAGNVSFDARHRVQQAEDNVQGTRNVVQAALSVRAGRFIHTSSAVAFGLHDSRIREDTASNALAQPVNYIRTKALAEAEVRKGLDRGLDAVILNPANIVGPYDRRGWAQLIGLVHAGRLPGIGRGRGSFCHAREVAAAHVSAVERGRCGHNYLLGGTDASYLEFAQVIEEIVGGKAPKYVMPELLTRLAGWIDPYAAALRGRAPTVTPDLAIFVSRDMIVDSTKAERDLDFRVMPLRPIIMDCANWLRQEGLLTT